MAEERKKIRLIFNRNEEFDNEYATWSELLESDKFVQTTDCMADEEIPNSACCLHVAAVGIDGYSYEEGIGCGVPLDLNQTITKARFSGSMQDAVINIAGHEHTLTFVDLNDDFGLSFKEISELVKVGELEVAVLVETLINHRVEDGI